MEYRRIHWIKNMDSTFSLLIGVMAVTFFLSCCDREIIEPSPKRNILFYIATDADANIDGDVPGKIDQIRAGWKPNQGEMLIYADRRGTGAMLLRINNTLTDGLYSVDTLDIYGIENSADAAVLRRVINKVVNDYPADSYGMIFFSHATGWLPATTFNYPRSSQLMEQPDRNEANVRSLVIDNGSGVKHEMDYVDFAAAIPDNLFDFIILEACLMADVMSMYELRSKAEYVLASSAEIVAPGFFYIYKDKIMGLYDTKKSVFSIVSEFAQAYHDFVIKSFPENNAFCSSSLGLIKMSEMNTLATTVKAALNGKMVSDATLTVDSIQRFDRLRSISNGQKKYRFFDLDNVMEELATGTQYAAFRTQLGKTVVWKASTKRFLLSDFNGSPDYSDYDGFFFERHCGLATYIQQSEYPELNAAYEESSWYQVISD